MSRPRCTVRSSGNAALGTALTRGATETVGTGVGSTAASADDGVGLGDAVTDADGV